MTDATTTCSWPIRRLGEFFKIKHGFAFKGEFFSGEGDYILVTPGNFEASGGFKSRGDREKFYIGSFPKGFLLKPGDLIVAMTDLTQNAPILGSAAFVPPSEQFLHNQRIGKIIELDETKVDRSFLYYLFNHRNVRAQIKATATGATVRHTAPDRIYAVEMPLPPLPTQRKIAGILSAYDDLIENNTRRIAILEEMAQRLYQEWFVHFRYPGHENVPLVDSELGPIPEGWEVKPFSEVAEFMNGFAFKPSQWGSMGRSIIKIAELKNGVTISTPRHDGSDIPRRFWIENGDLLFSWSADLDVYIWSHGSGLLNQHLFKVLPKDGLSKAFVYFLLKDRMNEFRNRSLGTTMRHIKRSALTEVTGIVPARQHISDFDKVVLPVLDETRSLQDSVAIYRRIRDLLLPQLIRGLDSYGSARLPFL